MKAIWSDATLHGIALQNYMYFRPCQRFLMKLSWNELWNCINCCKPIFDLDIRKKRETNWLKLSAAKCMHDRWQNGKRQKLPVQKTCENSMNLHKNENESRNITEHIGIGVFFFTLLPLYFSDRFVIYCNALRYENILLNMRMIHTIYRTQCTPFEINAWKFQCKSWMNKQRKRSLSHIMSSQLAIVAH